MRDFIWGGQPTHKDKKQPLQPESHLDRTELPAPFYFWDQSSIEGLQWLSLS